MQLRCRWQKLQSSAYMSLYGTGYVSPDSPCCNHVRRWDCHGLPVEHEIDKAFGVLRMPLSLYYCSPA